MTTYTKMLSKAVEQGDEEKVKEAKQEVKEAKKEVRKTVWLRQMVYRI